MADTPIEKHEEATPASPLPSDRRPSGRLIAASCLLAVLALAATGASVALEQGAPSASATLAAVAPNAGAGDGATPEVGGEGVAPASPEGIAGAEASGEGAAAAGDAAAASAEDSAVEELPDPEPIVSDGAGYATADTLLMAVSPGLLAALAEGAGDDAMTSWIENAFTFMPSSYVESWAASLGASSATDLAPRLIDREVVELAPTVHGGILLLEPGERCTQAEIDHVTERYAELNAGGTVTDAVKVRVATSEYPADVDPSQLSADGLYVQDAPYLAVQCGDAWFFYPNSFAER
ncbi:hypothetical protein [uncultured Adlercreutzia sp.]|uniref:hypothetical protein n=1 Tax=uncultured Adlercreutzia sp. TaxID=875803 RepID=UPI0025F03B12|nr:hypothetical protein [uncultured Adlercreutzia sp.]